jgi:pilus assembly protein Flp/PilA
MSPLSRLFAAIYSDPADERGQGLAEYALILALIAIVSIIALLYLGTQISDRLSEVGTAI